MIRATLRRKATTWAILLGCGFALVSCELEKVAGSSVTTGNPTEIQVGFTEGTGTVTVAGRVEIYAATQIPVPGFRPEPLARHDVNGTTFTLKASHFEGIADSLWAVGSLQGDSLALFNLVITGADKGAILRDLIFRIKEGKFALKAGDWKQFKGTKAEITAGVTALVSYQAYVDPIMVTKGKIPYVFLYGTGFYSTGVDGTYLFPSLPSGTHTPSFFQIPTKELQNSSPQDSVNVHELSGVLGTGPTPLNLGEVKDRVRIPDVLK